MATRKKTATRKKAATKKGGASKTAQKRRGKALAASNAVRRAGGSKAEAKAAYAAALGRKVSAKTKKGRKKAATKKGNRQGLPENVPVVLGDTVRRGRVVAGSARDMKFARLIQQIAAGDTKSMRIARKVLATKGHGAPAVVMPRQHAGPRKPRAAKASSRAEELELEFEPGRPVLSESRGGAAYPFARR